jgi:hypothetical protein
MNPPIRKFLLGRPSELSIWLRERLIRQNCLGARPVLSFGLHVSEISEEDCNTALQDLAREGVPIPALSRAVSEPGCSFFAKDPRQKAPCLWSKQPVVSGDNRIWITSTAFQQTA